MLSSGYIRLRLDWYRPILDRHEEVAAYCTINTQQLPLRTAGRDASEYIPYALHSHISGMVTVSVRRLHEYTVRYMIEGVKVSAHQLPPPDTVSRAMIQHLRGQHPHLPPHLLHHWCADAQGGAGLCKIMHGLWKQALKQELSDHAPWMATINILIIKLLRAAIAHLPDEHEDVIDEVMMRVIGGMYAWALQEFMRMNLKDGIAGACVSGRESLMMPITSIAFLRRQTADTLLGDSRQIISAYGLEPDIVPRLRELRRGRRDTVGDDAAMLAALGQDRMSDHLLKRCWARLSLNALAEESGQGAWMHWARDARRLDQLLSRPEEAGKNLAQALQPVQTHPFAAWLLARIQGGREAGQLQPWREDAITLHAFRVFDEDIKAEIARRNAETRWLDMRTELAGQSRGTETDRALEHAYREGKIVFLQTDFDQPLHGGKLASSKQACICMNWLAYLADMEVMYGSQMQDFLEQRFLPGILRILEKREDIFPDEFSAGGCLLRGPVPALLQTGIELRRQLRVWHQDKAELEGECPVTPACMAIRGEWRFARTQHGKLGECHVAFSPGLVQAVCGVAPSRAAAGAPSGGDTASRRCFPGNVHVETVVTGGGDGTRTLRNNGFAMTGPVLDELKSAMQGRLREYHVNHDHAVDVLSGHDVPEDGLDLYVIESGEESDHMALMLVVRVGRAALGGVDEDWYALLDPGSEAARLIIDQGLPCWTQR